MTVTPAARAVAERARVHQLFTPEQIVSIRLAVAQWMRSGPAVAEARDELRTLRVPPDEIFRRRRAESVDPRLAAALRLAVTLVITRGVLEESDRRRFAPILADDVVQRVITHVAEARRYVSQIEQSRAAAVSGVDLDVGDY